MGRRKKEPLETHRAHIASAAQCLFSVRGIESATMDDIAREAGYSKATLYVYFRDKREIVGYLVLESMKLLHSYMVAAVSGGSSTREKFHRICTALTQYQAEYPLYFTFTLGKINIDFEREDALAVERETFAVGEDINQTLTAFIHQGIASGALQSGTPALQTVFLLWASLTGLIQMAASKVAYIEQAMHLTQQEFLEAGFAQLYRLIASEETT